VRRANEVLVGAVVLGAIALAVAGTVWLSQARFGRNDQVQAARFRIIGGLKTGDPVVLRGVGIGRVEQIALGAANWVDVTLRLRGTIELPAQPVAIISSTTLFGDWGVQITSAADLPDGPEVRKQVVEATRAGRDKWPGATLPDIGQLTAQAGRIATDMALIVYALTTFALFKMIPVTLTLPGIAGFVLSIGVAVDANILIFERMKEELRGGRTLAQAIDLGFSRAWPSIRDSNLSTLITCLILYWFGSTFGASIVKGFALTLATGVLVSLFTAITVTRTFLHVILDGLGVGKHARWFGV